VSIKFTPENGRDVKHYHMYYVPLNGIVERYVTRYLDGMLSFVTTHFSDYAIVYDETVENETGKEDTTPSPTPGTAPTAMPSETAMPSTAPTTMPSETAMPTKQPSPTATPAPAVSAEEKATAALDLNAGLKVIHKGKTAMVQWGKVDGADFYRVYAGYCGGKVSLVKTVKGNAKCKITIKKLNGKKLSTTKNIKVYVAAYRKAEVTSGTGTVVKNVRIAKTITGHVVGKNNKKYSNAKEIEISKTSYTLNKGKKAQIKAKTVLEYPKRKQLGDGHAQEFRYASTDKSIATVSKTGKITAKKKGSCIIYVYARNGLAKKIKVKVK
ncbi:MAG: Ig-like domain-containing protein, partial [Lachnospiraceae bacterium]|nr:Ig-like domain-containing protein [Lachnospiraceae bacterium]